MIVALAALVPLALLPFSLLPEAAVLAAALLALAAIDLERGLLPDVLTLPLMAAGLALAWRGDFASEAALGAAAGWAGFAAVAALYRRLRRREGLGLGDAKLLAAAGAWLGWQALPGVVLIGALSALALALAGAAAGGKLTVTTRIAFGSHLALAFWLVWLFGPVIVA